MDIDDIVKAIFKQLGEECGESMMKPLRRVKRPTRDLSIYILSQLGTFTHKEIGERFGVGYTCITGTIKRAEKYLQDKAMNEKVEMILNDI